MRDLFGPAQSRAIRDLLQSLFSIEAVQPSQPLWLLSAWVTDAPMVDNGARQFAAVDPEWGAGPVVLSTVLRTMLERGGRVNIITRPGTINAPFIEHMRRLQRQHIQRLRLLIEEDFHDKGLVGDHYELAGSMNFTRRGIETNSEHLIFRTDPQIVAARHLELNARWGSRIDAAHQS
jgi:phosphatidylserine/phosphatidylglycerophosphate/cardiolipin synthase-like enzyme